MLDFTKFGIFLGIILFTKKLPTFTQFWDFGFFSCVMSPKYDTIELYYRYRLEVFQLLHYELTADG